MTGRTLTTAALLSGALLFATACGGGDLSATEAGGTSTTGTAGAAGDSVDLEDIPTMDELEDQMAETVTDENADEEFARLQAELAEEGDG